jgi:hypothetical protein
MTAFSSRSQTCFGEAAYFFFEQVKMQVGVRSPYDARYGFHLVLFQGTHERTGPVSRTRSIHPTDEVKKYLAVDER